MRRNLLLIPLTLVLILALSAISLAQPEPEGYGDRFVGFHIAADSPEQSIPDYEDGNWSFYAGKRVLWGVKTGDYYTFPGLEGKNCFLEWIYEDGESYLSSCSQLADTSLITGDKHSITGTLYSSAEILRFFRVYQTADGRIYLDGSGNGYSGGAGFSITEDRTWTEHTGSTVTQEETFHIGISVEKPSTVSEVAVKYFNEQDTLLETQMFDGTGDSVELSLPAGTAWALIEEHTVEGEAVRTVYTPGGSDRTHTVWFPDGLFYHPFVLTFSL